jgi:hypothetical protein
MDNFFSSLDPPMVRTADFANGRLIRVISLCSCRNCLNLSLNGLPHVIVLGQQSVLYQECSRRQRGVVRPLTRELLTMI